MRRTWPRRRRVINPYTGVAGPLDDMASVERPLGFAITPRAIHAARRTVRRALATAGAAHPVLVIGQDEGMIERVAVTAARKGGARLAIMPDGVRTTARVLKAGPVSRAIDAADRTLVVAGILSGRRSDFALNRPRAGAGLGPGLAGGPARAGAGRGCRQLRLPPFGRARGPPPAARRRSHPHLQPNALPAPDRGPAARDGRLVLLADLHGAASTIRGCECASTRASAHRDIGCPPRSSPCAESRHDR